MQDFNVILSRLECVALLGHENGGKRLVFTEFQFVICILCHKLLVLSLLVLFNFDNFNMAAI